MKVSFSPDIIPSGWLGSKHQLTNYLTNLGPTLKEGTVDRLGVSADGTLTSLSAVLHCGGLAMTAGVCDVSLDFLFFFSFLCGKYLASKQNRKVLSNNWETGFMAAQSKARTRLLTYATWRSLTVIAICRQPQSSPIETAVIGTLLDMSYGSWVHWCLYRRTKQSTWSTKHIHSLCLLTIV